MKKSNLKRVLYAQAVYGEEEIKAVEKVLRNPLKIGAGPHVRKFETKVASLFGKPHAVMVNSGSSANLLALELIKLQPGSEVITPILTFSTTLAPIVQRGLIPVLVDVIPGKYVIDADQIEKHITKKTKAILVPLLLGNVPDLKKLAKIAKKHKLWLIEDSCDTIDARLDGKPTGVYSDISTTSFYASHIITAAGGGGMICFKDGALAKRALVMSCWGRDSTLFGAHEKSEEMKKRFKKGQNIGGLPYDAKFIFSEIGYNIQGLEVSGAFGLQQLKRLPKFSKIRQNNFNNLLTFFKKYEQFFILPQQYKGVKTNWLAFPLTIKEGAPFTRNEITWYLEGNNIQTRPIFTGNALHQPAFRDIKHRKIAKKYPVTDMIMHNAFLVGSHHGLEKSHLDYLKKAFATFLDRYTSKLV